MPTDNRAIAKAFIASFPSGKIDTSLMADEFTAWSTSSGEMEAPAQRLPGGVSVLATVFASPMQIDFVETTAEGDRVVIEANSSGPLVDGQEYSNRYVFVLRMKDGKVTRFEEHNNPIEVREKLGPLMKAAMEKMAAGQASSHTALPRVERPSHIPADLEVDFDFYNPPVDSRDVHAGWMELQQGPRMVWTGHNGGHWIATRADDLIQIQTDYDRFSYRSINIPPNPTPSLPLECDPPRHTGLRAIISPLFRPDTLKAAEQAARELASSLADELKDKGACEFQDEFARQVPILVFLKLVDLPVEDRKYLIGLAEKRTRSPIAEERNSAKAGLIAYMLDAIEERTKNPRGDFISRIIHSTVDGQPLRKEDLLNMLATTLSGGLDTVASMTGFAMYRLAERPDLQERLQRDPDIVNAAVDEIIRRNGLSNICRIATRDMEFAGAPLREGDAIVTPSSLIGLDPDHFPNPTVLDFDRKSTASHGTFGNGPHRCPGANLGRMEIRVMLQEWTKRIPRWRIDPERTPSTGSGLVNTVHHLNLVWDA